MGTRCSSMDAAKDGRDPDVVAAALEKLSYISRTALLVAYDRSVESARPDAFFVDPWSKVIAGESGKSISQSMSAQPFVCNLGEDGKPGAWPEFHLQWTAVRTRLIDDVIAAELGGGVRQFVCLGAGVDLRPCRLDGLREHSESARWFDVETAEMHEARGPLLDGLGATPLCRHAPISCDLAAEVQQLPERLAAKGWDPKLPTVWILEGLLMYMAKPAQEALLTRLGRGDVSAASSTAIINFLFAPDHGQFGRESAVDFLRQVGFDGPVDAASFGEQAPAAQGPHRVPARERGGGGKGEGEGADGGMEPGLDLHCGRYREGAPPDPCFSFVLARKAMEGG